MNVIEEDRRIKLLNKGMIVRVLNRTQSKPKVV